MSGRLFVKGSCPTVRSAAALASFVAVVLMGSLQVHAQDTWTLSSSLSGDWNNGGNWSAGVPTSSSNVVIANGGTTNVAQLSETCGTLSLGSSAGSGTVQMAGGSLSVTSDLDVGYSGTGTFTQSGGSNSAGFYLDLGENVGSSGTYYLSGSGLVSAYNERVGVSGTGTFTQSGGTNNISTNHDLIIGNNGGGYGVYNLSGSGLVSASGELLGYSGSGTFNQSGGTNNGGAISFALNFESGIYNLSGGLLILPSVSLGSGKAAFNFSGGTLQAGASFSTSLPMTLGTGGGGATLNTAGYAVTLSGSLSGPSSLNKIGSGMLTLGSANTFTGNTLINGGTLALGSSLALQNSTLDTSGSGVPSFGSLTSATLGGLTGPGAFNLANIASAAVTLNVGNNNTSTTYSGTLKGAGSLAKIGSGTLLLTGSDIYSGPTTINQGSLVVNGSLVSPVTVNSGGMLGGSGSLSSVTVTSGGSLSPGATPGAMNVSGSLALLSGARWTTPSIRPRTATRSTCPRARSC